MVVTREDHVNRRFNRVSSQVHLGLIVTSTAGSVTFEFLKNLVSKGPETKLIYARQLGFGVRVRSFLIFPS
jgi:hypothetical protein